ncbi:DMT family transporter [Enteractinococcus coprophilus]|uniref:DME family drug/metabolite transporter n=1 Tax=Enteractinococcus coprophilus TaxID=1027633 RepID=A0A543AFB1_9MICC|nr:EamA family transporter [Enteractinococcus coprophilus]TQL71265.1 DME family drug/metabolite transporter [Enteractinococcus coprophilus]
MNRNRLWGIGAVLVAAFLWGTTGTAATFARDVGPLAIGAAALGIGGLLQALVAIPALRRARLHLRAHRKLVMTGALAVFLYPLAFYSSMHLAGVAIGTVISLASAPLASGILERVIDRRRLGIWWYVAALLGITGSVLLIASTQHNDVADAGSTVFGIGLGLLAGAAYALYSWVVQRLMTDGVGRAAAMGSVFGLGGAALMPVLFMTGGPLLATPEAFAVGTYMALVPMFLGYVAFGYGLSKIPASSATTLTLFEPAVATVLAVLIVGERLTLTGWVGLGIFGIVLLILGSSPQPSKRNNTSARPVLVNRD